MERSRKIWATLKNHKKKSIFFIGCLGYGSYYAYNSNRRNKIFKVYCEAAKEFGEQPIGPADKSRKVTVLINESAKDGKCRYDFEKYALPMLHLAGLEIEIIKPKDDKQFTDIASVVDLKDTDALYVVGGDGTVSRVVNGLMAQINSDTLDNDKSLNVPPIAVFPGGFENNFVKQIFPYFERSKLQWYCENAISIIKGVINRRSVIEVKMDEAEPFYAAQSVHLGNFAQVERSKYKYWYWASFKRSFAYLWNSLWMEPRTHDYTFSYTEPCEGCSICRSSSTKKPNRKRSWLRRFLFKPYPVSAQPQVDYSKVVNTDCGKIISTDLKSSEVFVTTDRNQGFRNLKVLCGPETSSRITFVKEGLKRGHDDQFGISPSADYVAKSISARSLEITVPEHSADQTLTADIDGTSHSFRSRIYLNIIPEAIRVFAPVSLSNP